MKRMIGWIVLVLCLCVLAGCECRHEWIDATCTAPKTCTKCGITEGEVLWHNWRDATCTEPKTCAQCGLTEGSKLGHDWELATCEVASTCKTCGAVEGMPLGHFPEDWKLVSLDPDRLIKVYEQRCNLCKQKIDERSEVVTSFVENNMFMLTPNQIMQRFAAIAKENGLELRYTYTNTGVGAGGIVQWDESGLVVQYMRPDQTMVNMQELETVIAACASLATIGQVDDNLPLYFMVACDPSLDLESAAELYQQLREDYEDVKETDGLLHHIHNGMMYEFMYVPMEGLGINGAMAMINIYAGNFPDMG